ncbi:MAG: bifunctional transaldolase/phosoglucose isomerase [Deltaproteobacteria bacterium]|nr:bifunctional transaldolase/phosoglucose isomerase [Deltaproteobacteria bacterium]
MNPLLRLNELGQSVWYDHLRRGLITSGELRRMIEEYGVSGVTSNPAIFERAVSGTNEYDPDIASLAAEGKTADEILKRLTLDDIRHAADIFKEVYEETDGADGFVSIEVRPDLARDVKGTVKEALALFSALDRDNVMVKVPATVEGIAAVEELVYEGKNINVTLLFSVKRYEEAALAYILGLERRLAEGKTVSGISSVASFFVSRVDARADRTIGEMIRKAASHDSKARLVELAGKVAVANAKLAYIRHSGIFGGERFKKLEEKGAAPQRLLWASTGTKNPAYSDVKYVEELIAGGTVNTMPLETMLAFHSHGEVERTLPVGLEEAKKVISELSAAGIDYDGLTGALEKEGVEGFQRSYDALRVCITAKMEAARMEKEYGAGFSIKGFEGPVKEALKKLSEDGFLVRLWEKDPTLWKKDPDEKKLIRNSLGWLTVAPLMEANRGSIERFAAEIKEEGFKHAVLMGMGGSSLAPLVMRETFGPVKGYPELIVLDSTDPEAVKGTAERIDIAKTLFIMSSKSGSTIEPLSLFEYFYERLFKVRGEEAGRNFIGITDPGTALEGFSRKYRFRRLFINPHDIGGRFSALSYFGLVPAAVAGVDIGKLLYHAARVSAATEPCVRVEDSAAVRLGAVIGTLAAAGRDKLTFFLSKEISTFGLWIEQLVAESTGKEGTGVVPVSNEPPASPEAYGDDRLFVSIGVGKPSPSVSKTFKALADAGHPVLSFVLEDQYELGGEMFKWEVATAVAGRILGINPFDQPDVEIAKKMARNRLNGAVEKGALTPPGVALGGKDFGVYLGKTAYERIGLKDGDAKKAMKGFMGLIRKGDYLGVLAYLNPFDERLEEALVRLRKDLRDSTGAATQFGYGPRYLHSTGQLHKGGANKGVFIILTHRTDKDQPVPGSSFSFSELELSQAFGDMEALESKGCRVALIDLKDSSKGSIEEVESFLKGALKG